MRIDVVNALAALAICVTLLRAGIETEAKEAEAQGFPWWSTPLAGLLYGLVALWAFANENRPLLLAACLVPFAFSFLHWRDLRAGHPTVWLAFLSGLAGAIAQAFALWGRGP